MYQDFFPHIKKQEKCFEDEQAEVIVKGYDSYGNLLHKRQLDKDGNPLIKPWPHDIPVAQIGYENWLQRVVNEDTKEFYPALNKQGNPIKGTGPKRIVQQIIRLKRKDGKEYLYQSGRSTGMTLSAILLNALFINQKCGK